MEWDKIKQKWSEMTGRVQSPQLPGDRNVKAPSATSEAGKQMANTNAGVLPVGGSDERHSV